MDIIVNNEDVLDVEAIRGIRVIATLLKVYFKIRDMLVDVGHGHVQRYVGIPYPLRFLDRQDDVDTRALHAPSYRAGLLSHINFGNGLVILIHVEGVSSPLRDDGFRVDTYIRENIQKATVLKVEGVRHDLIGVITDDKIYYIGEKGLLYGERFGLYGRYGVIDVVDVEETIGDASCVLREGIGLRNIVFNGVGFVER